MKTQKTHFGKKLKNSSKDLSKKPSKKTCKNSQDFDFSLISSLISIYKNSSLSSVWTLIRKSFCQSFCQFGSLFLILVILFSNFGTISVFPRAGGGGSRKTPSKTPTKSPTKSPTNNTPTKAPTTSPKPTNPTTKPSNTNNINNTNPTNNSPKSQANNTNNSTQNSTNLPKDNLVLPALGAGVVGGLVGGVIGSNLENQNRQNLINSQNSAQNNYQNNSNQNSVDSTISPPIPTDFPGNYDKNSFKSSSSDNSNFSWLWFFVFFAICAIIYVFFRNLTRQNSSNNSSNSFGSNSTNSQKNSFNSSENTENSGFEIDANLYQNIVEKCAQIGVLFVNKKVEFEADEQIWEVQKLPNSEPKLDWQRTFGTIEENVKLQIETVFENYQNDWMTFGVRKVENYTTAKYQNELWETYQNQMKMDKRDVIINPKINGIKLISFANQTAKFQINAQMINFKLWEIKKIGKLTKIEEEKQGTIASGSIDLQEFTEFWNFKIENGRILLAGIDYE